MKQEILLNGVWEMRDDLLEFDPEQAALVDAQVEDWLAQPVPGDIHQGLIKAKRIAEPLLGMNSYACEWTEKRSWWLRRDFDLQASFFTSDCIELELNGLDSNAEIFLNGMHIGSHRSAFYPFVKDVRAWLHTGSNRILIRLSSGVEQVTEEDVAAMQIRTSTEAGNGRPERGDWRRAFARKPQYSWGWDWSPRVPTSAIGGDVRLRALSEATVRDVSLRPQRIDGGVRLSAQINVEGLHFYKTCQGAVTLKVISPDRRVFSASSGPCLLRSGLNHIDLAVEIPNPLLWWPNGLGKPHLHKVEVALECGAGQETFAQFEYGIRFLELETQPDFALHINGRKIFCKGANWIPADTIYARVSAARYARLVGEAAAAHFNMLRVWGGGLYEPEAFYTACDRKGILIWQDFMFACTPYPDHLDWFREEVRREAEFQTRRLSRHACIGLWSGSNENNWGFDEWWKEQTRSGAWIYNHLLPEVVRRNDPGVPYWNGSPYGGAHPNSAEVGDRHHWFDAMMNPDMNKRITPEIYDQVDARFISEFGYIGACSKETTLHYLDGQPAEESSPAWQHHTNTFEKLTVRAGIQKHYTDPEKLDLDQYLLYSGLTQGLMYGYALDALRANPRCHGGLFWMFADCWGEVGWTIIDALQKRKPSYYFVRRAFQPLRLILRPYGFNELHVTAANDLAEDQNFELEYGYVTLDGLDREVQRTPVCARALSRTRVLRFSRGPHGSMEGLWYARIAGANCQASLFRALDFRNLKRIGAEVKWEMDEAQQTIKLESNTYAHAVQILLPPGYYPEDNYFDLLPGETRLVGVAGKSALSRAEIQLSWI